MNAAVSLLGKILPATVHVHAEIPETHASARILGTERMGSGTVIDSAGIILTVSYVVIGAERITVTTLDQQRYDAELVKYDFASGLAVLRLRGVRLPSLPLRRTDELAPGEPAFVVASLGEGQIRVADGFVTCVGPFEANWEYVLERGIMASAMNPGLGGGPLVDRFGEVLGVVSLNLAEIGKFTLTVPSDCFLDAAPAFLTHDGNPSLGERPWLGVFCHLIDDHVVVAGLMEDGPGQTAGLQPGDVVLAVDDLEISDRATLYRHVWDRAVGDEVALRVFRDAAVQAVTVVVGDAAAHFA